MHRTGGAGVSGANWVDVGAYYTVVTEQSAQFIGYPNGGTSSNSLNAIATGTKTLACYTWGSGSSHTYFKSASGNTAYSTTATVAPTKGIGTQLFIMGADSASYNLTGYFYGGFFSESFLDQTQMNALYDAVIGSGCP